MRSARASLSLVLPVLLACSAFASVSSVDLRAAALPSDDPARGIQATIWFQGFLADATSGDPVNATYDVIAEIFDAAENGDSVWGPETHSATLITEGWFNIELGSNDPPLPDFSAPPYYLQLTVNGEVLTPRQKLASVPTALRAGDIDAVVGDVTAVNAGDGLMGGGSSGDVTLDIGPGDGLDVSDDVITVDVTDLAGDALGEDGANNLKVNVGSGLDIAGDAVGLSSAYGSGSAYDNRFVNHLEANSVTLGMIQPSVLSSLDGVWSDGGNIDLIAGSNVTITPDDGSKQITIASAGGADSDWTVAGNDVYSAVSGNVGIGTSGPQRKLHLYEDVDGALSYPVKLENFGSGAGTATGILFKVDTGGEDRGKGAIAFERTNTWNRGRMHILLDNGANYDVASLDDAVMTFLPGGGVGIGTTEPGAKLGVDGHVRITDYSWPTSGEGLELAYNAALNRGYVFAYDRDASTDGQLALGNGNVGIGTTNPTEQLQVAGTIHSTSGGFKFPDETVQTTAAAGSFTLPYTGSTSAGVSGFFVVHTGTGHGLFGKAVSGTGRGVYGLNESNGPGVYGFSTSGTGVDGVCYPGIGVSGTSTSSYGVYGTSTSSYGVFGYSTVAGIRGQTAGSGRGVSGKHQTADYYGYMGSDSYGVYGGNESTTGIFGYLGGSRNGVYGETDDASGQGAGVVGVATNYHSNGVRGESNGGADGYLGVTGSGGYEIAVYGGLETAPDYSGFFNGPVEIVGPLTKPLGSFKIDHPLDPTNKNLYHSFVESPDMMNIYNGNVVLDEGGEAWIKLPEWFEALNQEFRYQLTCIGGFAQVYVAQEIRDNRFRIAGGTPGMKVSWQVTGVRHDPYAEAHRIPVEEDKRPEQLGKYLHPEVYGQTRTMAVFRDPREVAAEGE